MAAWTDRRFWPTVLLLGGGLGVGVAMIAAVHRFDGLYGQDAFAYAGVALGPFRDALSHARLLPDFPLPPGYPLLISLASLVVGPSDAIARAVSLLCGAAIPLLIPLLAREVRPDLGRGTLLFGAALAAVTPQLWQSSLVAMSDTPAAAVATLGAWAIVRFDRQSNVRWLLLGVAALAFAVEIRLIAAVVAVPLGILAARRIAADPAPRRRRILVAAGALGMGLLALAPMLVPIVAAVAIGRQPPFLVEVGVAPFDPLTPLRSSFETADGALRYAVPMGLWALSQPLQAFWFAGFGPLTFLGAWLVARRRPAATEAFTLLAWPILTLAVLAFYSYQNPRFALVAIAPMAILAALGGRWLAAFLSSRTSARRASPWVAALIVLGINVGLAVTYTDRFATRQVEDLAAIRWLEARIPDGTTTVSLGATAALAHDGRSVVELYDLDPGDAERYAATGGVDVLVQADVMASQWAATPAGVAFRILARAPSWHVVAASGTWTLVAIDR